MITNTQKVPASTPLRPRISTIARGSITTLLQLVTSQHVAFLQARSMAEKAALPVAALLLALLSNFAAADGGGGHGHDAWHHGNGHGDQGDGYGGHGHGDDSFRIIKTKIRGLEASNADAAADGITAGDTIVITGRYVGARQDSAPHTTCFCAQSESRSADSAHRNS